MVLIGHGMPRGCCGRFATASMLGQTTCKSEIGDLLPKTSVSAAHAFRIVLHTVPRVGCSHGLFPGGFYLHLLHTACNVLQVVFESDSLRSGNRRCP